MEEKRKISQNVQSLESEKKRKKTFSNLLIDLNVHVRSPVAFIIATTRKSTEFLFRKFEAFSHLHSKFSSTVVLK